MRSAVATRSGRSPTTPCGAGVGLRLPHLAEVAAVRPAIGWLEVHPENFLANPHARELLLDLAERYPISLHSVGVSIGSADGIDRTHLERIRQLIVETEPCFVSGHLAWSTIGGIYLNDLLPIPYDEDSLKCIAAQVHEVQDAIGRPYLVENPATYAGFGTSTLDETQFLRELVQKTDCRLLLDVSNVVVSAANMGFDAYDYIDRFPGDAVDEFHLGGFTRETDEADADAEILIDTHDRPIASEAWNLYAYAVGRHGTRPTLIEWDNALPELDVLLAEAARADAFTRKILEGPEWHVSIV